jgi:hypothetical protein
LGEKRRSRNANTFHFLFTRFFAKKKQTTFKKAPDGITFAHQQRTMMGNASSSSSSSVVFSQTIAEGQARGSGGGGF